MQWAIFNFTIPIAMEIKSTPQTKLAKWVSKGALEEA